MRLHKLLLFAGILAILGFSACGGSENKEPSSNESAENTNKAPSSDVSVENMYKAPSSDVSAEITMMMWSGDNTYWTDIGGKDLRPEELFSQQIASAYATAKLFKNVYPNVKINIFAKSEGPDDGGFSWAQHRENFAMEYGHYPDIYNATDVFGDAQRGLVADLSVFKNDPVYQSFNPSVMALINIEGRQFGIPEYLIPWGIYVNKSLAESQNIDMPDPNWTIDEFTRFVTHSKQEEYWGMMGGFGVDIMLVQTGTKDFTYQLLNRKPGEAFVNINSDATRKLLGYMDRWTKDAVWPQWDQGLISAEVMNELWWWPHKYFIEGKLLVNTEDPWMMGDAAHPDINHWGSCNMPNWDIYPRPSTDYVGNHIGVVMDPFVVRNYAMDDGDPALSDEEYNKLQITWEFMKFWAGDTGAWEARAHQLFQDGDLLKSCMNDSLPLVTGPAFKKQMEMWYIPEIHQRFADKNKMPGWHYVLELWEKGEFWDISDKTYPWYYDFEGDRREIVHEWLNAYNADITGVSRFEPNWLDNFYAKLPEWNTTFNQRWEAEMQKMQDSLNRYYPKK